MTSVLKVDTIQNSSGTDALTVDSSGALTASNQPLVSARSENAGQVSAGNIVIWNIEDIDRGGNFASNVFTAPVAGNYMVNTSVLYDNTNDAISHLRLDLDTGSGFSAYVESYADRDSGDYKTMTITAIVDLSSGDKVRIFNQNGAIYGGGSKYHSLCIYLLP